jgi:hypothetical protein
VLGWAIEDHLRTDLVETALRRAVTLRDRDTTDVIFHADRGCQGEFKRSSQHLDLKVLDGEKAAGCRSCAASEDAFAGQVGFCAAG